MNKAIAHILKEALADNIPAIDKIAGLVEVAEYQETNYGESGETPNTIIKRIPKSCDVADAGCGDEHLVPDKSKRGILYFEDGGITALGKQGGYFRYRSRLRLVVWLNTTRITNNTCYDAPAILQNSIIAILDGLNTSNSGHFLKLQVTVDSIPKNDKGIFSPYTYDLHNTQYLMLPYDFFALDLAVEFQMVAKCVDALQFSEPSNDCP